MNLKMRVQNFEKSYSHLTNITVSKAFHREKNNPLESRIAFFFKVKGSNQYSLSFWNKYMKTIFDRSRSSSFMIQASNP